MILKKISFSDYINKKRVDYCIELLESGRHRNKTLEAIARLSGFNNRNTFTKAFKKFKGKTPSSYLKVLNVDHWSSHAIREQAKLGKRKAIGGEV